MQGGSYRVHHRFQKLIDLVCRGRMSRIHVRGMGANIADESNKIQARVHPCLWSFSPPPFRVYHTPFTPFRVR